MYQQTYSDFVHAHASRLWMCESIENRLLIATHNFTIRDRTAYGIRSTLRELYFRLQSVAQLQIVKDSDP